MPTIRLDPRWLQQVLKENVTQLCPPQSFDVFGLSKGPKLRGKYFY